jgi:hypothetical protein
MTDTASRPDMEPAAATLTPPSDTPEDIETSTKTDLAPPSWLWPTTAAGAQAVDGVATDESPSTSEAEVAVTGIAAPETRIRGMSSSLGPVGRHRSTLAVVILSIVTLGVYTLVWHHRVNREVGYFDTRMHVGPGRSTLALTIPWVLGWLVSIAGATRIVLAVANVHLAFDPHFTVLQAYGLLAGGLLIPYLTLLLPFSAIAWVMTLERVRIVEDRIGRTTDVQLRPARMVCWLLVPVIGGLVLVAAVQARLNRVWQDDKALTPPARPSVKVAAI